MPETNDELLLAAKTLDAGLVTMRGFKMTSRETTWLSTGPALFDTMTL